MSIAVNPPPQLRIPDEFFNNPDIRAYFEQYNTILFQLWNRTGGSEDVVDNSQQDLTSMGSRVARNAVKINALEKTSFDVEIISVDFTTSRNQIIICQNTSVIDITLDPNAIQEDQIHIKRTSDVVNVIGNIDGDTSKKINVKYFSMHLVFNGVEWSQI